MNEKTTIDYSVFSSVDIRTGLVRSAETIEGSDKLYKLSVDLGSDYGTVTIASGLRPWYSPEDLIGKKFLFVANLEPRKLMGLESAGMILACDGEEKPILAQMSDELAPGARIR